MKKEFYSNKLKANHDKADKYFTFAQQIVYMIKDSKTKCFILNSSENANTNLKLLAHNLRKKSQVFFVDDRKIEKEYFKQIASNDIVICFYSGLENEELHNNLKILSKISKNIFIITTCSHYAHLKETISENILVLKHLEWTSSSIRSIQRSILK